MRRVNFFALLNYEGLSAASAKDNTVDRWLTESRIDLVSSRLLYDHKIYARALFNLQQSNEKLAKGLLLLMGFLTPKQLNKDWTTKALLGFLPKEPIAYGHRTVPALLSDIDNALPSLELWFQHLEAGEFKPKIAAYRKTLRETKKGLKALRKKDFRLVDTAEHLENEIKGAEALLDNVDKAMDTAKQELGKFDFPRAVQAAIKSTQNLGFKFDPKKLPSYLDLKDEFVPRMRLAVIGTLAILMTAILDPLESVTRYPDSKHGPFDENDPYVKQFEGLYRVVARLLEASRSSMNNPAVAT